MKNFEKIWGKPSKAVVQSILAAVMVLALLAASLPVVAATGNGDTSSMKPSSGGLPTDTDSKPSMQFSDMGMSGVQIDYAFPYPEVSATDVEGTVYQYLHIDGFGKLGAVGKPALPMRHYTVALPIGADIRIEILESEAESVHGYLIHPAFEPALDTAGAPDPEFEIDEDFYRLDENYPQAPVQVVAINELRGISLVQVQVCPVQYNPARKQLTVYSRLKFRVEFVGGTALDPAANTPHFYQILNNVVINSEIIPLAEVGIQDSVENGRSDIIVITHSDYLTAANALAEWKRMMGYDVEVVSQSSWTTAQVKSAIHDRYAAWSPKPDYFVIIGDHGDVPAEDFDIFLSPDTIYYVSDLYYACMDGSSDFYPDMAYGRISVSSSTEANNVIDKIIDYERDPISTASFYTHGTACAVFQDRQDPPDGYADRRFAQTSEEMRDHLISEGYTINRVYDLENNTIDPTNWNDGRYSSGEAIPADLRKPGFAWDGDAADITSSINAGRFIVLFRDHGGITSWSNPPYTTTNIAGLDQR